MNPPPATLLAQTERAVSVPLEAEALAHRALRHPWLKAFSNRDFADFGAAVRHYARAYHGYSAWFTRYLETVIDRLDDPEHRDLLSHNLAEEKGALEEEDQQILRELGFDPAEVDGVPHSQLFVRFAHAVGVSDAELAEVDEAASWWRSRFLHLLQTASPAEAVGALGPGTEGVVAAIYEQLLGGLRGWEGLPQADRVFFDLHCHVDDQHAKDLEEVGQQIAQRSKNGRRELRRGMLRALDLRAEFFDALARNSEMQSWRSAGVSC